MEDIMQRMKQLTAGATLAALALSGVAFADDGHKVEAKASVGVDHPADTTWANGLTREQIKDVQTQLAARNLYKGKVDGSPGPMTHSALRNFQIQNKLETSHGLDAPTRQALGLQWGPPNVAPNAVQPVSGDVRNDTVYIQRSVGNGTTITTPVPAGTVPGPQVRLNQLNKDQAKTLQTRLRELGYYRGEVDGVVGENTRAALEQYFRTQADLAAQGIISDATIGLFANSPSAQQPR
jgi:peptidoglycan hydrolase-like protein with peptidoglycan-binding domain